MPSSSPLLVLLRAAFPGDWKAEHHFMPGRDFAFDFAELTRKVALEVEGGVYGKGKPCPVCKRRRGGAHGSISGILRDIEKYNEAAVLNWKVIRATPEQVDSGEAFAWVERALENP